MPVFLYVCFSNGMNPSAKQKPVSTQLKDVGDTPVLREAWASMVVHPTEPLIDLAYIAGAWGVRGWVRLSPFSADADALHHARQWFVVPPKGAHASTCQLKDHLQVQVLQLKPQADALVAQWQGFDNRDWAQALRGATIALPRSAFPSLPDGEYYWIDLIGLEVRNRQGLSLGCVEKMLSNGPQSVLVVQGEKGAKQHLIPFVDAYVDTVDLQGRCVTVDWQPDY